MPNGPRRVENIHILPDDMVELPIESQLFHAAKMLDSYLGRLFTHVYGIESTLQDEERGILPRLRSVESFQANCRENDPIDAARWVKNRRRFEGKVLVAVVTAILVQSVGLAFLLFGHGGGV